MDIYRIMNGLVDNATNDQLSAPDQNSMREVSELVRSRADMPKEVIKLINNKLMKRDKKVTMLSLELLEYLSYSCEITLYNQISTKDFLVKMGNVLRSTDLGEQVILRACCLIKCWRELFNKELHQFFFQFYDNVVKRGIDIPSNYSSPYASLKGQQPSTSTSFGSSTFKQSTPSSSTFGKSTNNSSLPASGPKAKLRSDLEAIKSNITLVNQMIDEQDPKGNVDQNEQLTNLIQTLKSSETQTQSLIEKLATENDEGLLELCLSINDDMQSTFERHSQLRKHLKPKPFRGKGVEDEVLKQIENLEISGKNNANSESIFANTAQALSQGLAKAQGSRIPPPTQPPSFQPISQPPVYQAPPPQPQKPAATLIDLLDDDLPVQTAPQNQNVPPATNNNYELGGNQGQPSFTSGSVPTYNQPNTFVQPPTNFGQPSTNFGQPSTNFGQPPTNFVQPPTNFVSPPNNFGQSQNFNQPQNQGGLLYQQSQQQQQPPNQQQNKYAAFNQVNPPAIGGYPQTGNNLYAQTNPQGYNTGATVPPAYGGQQYGGYNTQPTGYGLGGGLNTQPQGYGMPTNNGYGVQNSVPPMGGYGGGLPTVPQTGANKQPGYGQTANTKNAFDDLDDMFGIGGNSGPANNNKPPQKQGQPQIQPSAAKQIDFDLF